MTSQRLLKRLLIGVGNEFRQDDGIGLAIVRQLKSQLPPEITTIEASGEGVALMEAWQGFDRIYLVDAVASGSPPGTIHRIDAQQQSVPTQFFNYSTHAFSVAEAVELARSLGQLPPQVVLFGMEGERFRMGVGFSDAVTQAIPQLLEQIMRELAPELVME